MKTLKPATLIALLTAATVTAYADQTNLVENIQINLVGLLQGGTTTNRNTVTTSVNTTSLGNRQVIQALAAATGRTFSQNSRLVLITPLGGGDSSVEVRSGNIHVDVGGFFSLQTVSAAMTSSVTNTRNGNSSSVTYSIQHFVMQDSPFGQTVNTHFDLNGLGADFSANHSIPGPDNNLNMDVAGIGDRNGTPLVIQGSISISGQTLEVVATNDSGPS